MKTGKILAILVTILILGAAAGAVFSSRAAAPEAIWLSWQNDPRTTITINWRTESAQTSALAEYGRFPWLESEAPGATVAGVETGKWYHSVELTNLQPDTTYHYRVQGTDGEWTPTRSFRTAPDGSKNFRFAVLGDSGTIYDGTPASQTIKQMIAERAPDFVLAAGGLTYADGDTCLDGTPCVERSWEQWFTEITQFASAAPILAVPGEHELASRPVPGQPELRTGLHFPWGEFYFSRTLSQPSEFGEGTYSFDYGDAHIVGLNSHDLDGLAGGWQYRWLIDDLDATDKKWKIVFLHHPPYSSGRNGSTLQLQKWLGPVFDQFGVDLVFSAHDYGYERTYPLRNILPDAADQPVTTSIDPSSYKNPEGTIYVVTAGGGISSGGRAAETPYWSAAACNCFEFVETEIVDDRLTVRTIDVDGNEVDAFSIRKTESQDVTIYNTPVARGASAPSPRGSAAHWPIRGFNLVAQNNEYLRPDIAESLAALRETGANFVAVAPIWFQEGWNSSEIFVDPTKSPSGDALRSMIRKAKAQGLRVAIKPLVLSRDRAWSGFFEPTDPERWLASYRRQLLATAELAGQENVDLLILGTELRNLTATEYADFWRDMIRGARERFPGEITYSANWTGEYERINFWDALDLIAVSANFPAATTLDASIEDMVAGWRGGVGEHWFRDLEVTRTRWEKDVLFAEIGYQARNGTALRPWASGGTIDEEEQARAYQAAFTVWQDVPWFRGMLFWHWPADPAESGPADGSTSVRGKLAEAVVKRFWRAE